MIDRQGRLVTCEQGSRRVTRTEPDGSITVVAAAYDGKRRGSPNDMVVRSDGSIWFTDPRYGITRHDEGHAAESEIGGDHVYRIDPETGELSIVADDFVRPNGLAFSADESELYIVETRLRSLQRCDLDYCREVAASGRRAGHFPATVGVSGPGGSWCRSGWLRQLDASAPR